MVDTHKAERYIEEHGWCKIDKSAFEDNYYVYIGRNYNAKKNKNGGKYGKFKFLLYYHIIANWHSIHHMCCNTYSINSAS